MVDHTTQRWLVTGATGFIGKRLIQSLLQDGIKVTGFSRQPVAAVQQRFPNVDWINDLHKISEIAPTHVVNLAGEGIADARWTTARKAQLYESRVKFSKTLSDCLAQLSTPPEVVISGSAIGYYGTGHQACTETSSAGHGFSAALCQAWETAMQAEHSRLIHLRIGVVMGQGGMLAKLKPIYQIGLGGRLGSGDQILSWIQRDDLVRLIRWLVLQPELHGPINATAPNPMNQRRFAQHFAKALKRPAFLPTPALSMRLLYGEMAEELLLSGQTVLPDKVTQAGFRFAYPWMCQALTASLQPEDAPWWPCEMAD